MSKETVRQRDNGKAKCNLQSMGLTFSSAINIFFTKINQTHKILFDIEACPYGSNFVDMMEESLADYDAGRYVSFIDDGSMQAFIISGGEDNAGVYLRTRLRSS